MYRHLRDVTIEFVVLFSECSNCEVCIVWWDRRQRRNFSVLLGRREGSNHVYGLLKASYMVSCLTQFKAFWTGVLCSYVSQTLVVAATTGCLHVSICMCITFVQPFLYRRSIWIEPTARWRFTTSYEKAQWQDICLWRSSRQKGEPRGQRGPSGRTSVSRSSSWFQLKSQLNFREEGLLMSTAGSRRDTLPSLTSPFRGQ